MRDDIQALRGLAVLLVLAFHAEPGFARSGFLGVDIFFVISGFLITAMIRDGISQGTFTIAGFYARRARRLLPAAYMIFLATAILAPFCLTANQLRDFAFQLLGAITLTGNIVLWLQTGYFEGAAETKPLLHVWSLAVEEQFYLVLPAFLLLLPRRVWWLGLSAVTCVSLIYCMKFAHHDPTAKFYLLHTRAWELGIGAIAAVMPWRTLPGLRITFWPALSALIVIPLFAEPSEPPGRSAMAVCAATIIVILRQHPLFERGLPAVSILAFVGTISYSLYLVHWPVLVFLRSVWIGVIPAPVTLAAVALSVGLAWLLYRHVEEPFRHSRATTTKTAIWTVAGSVSMMAFIPGILRIAGDPLAAEGPNYGLHRSCDAAGSIFAPSPACQTSEHPKILLWGDSYAMHLTNALKEGPTLVQATKSVCAPLLDLAAFERTVKHGVSAPKADQCIRFNRSVLTYLAQTPSIDTIILSSAIGYMLDRKNFMIRDAMGESYVADDKKVTQALRTTVTAIRALGKRAVIVSPPPFTDFNIGACHARRTRGLVTFGADDACRIDQARYKALSSSIDSVLSDAEDVAPIIRLNQLCDGAYCRTEINGYPIYADGGHFSPAGSALFGSVISLSRRIKDAKIRARASTSP